MCSSDLEAPAALGALLADPKVEVVFHDADYDLRLLHQDYGWRPTNLFDTRIAAQLLGIQAFGLAALLERGTFPDVAVKMVEVGESTGALQEMLNSLADFYDDEIETEVARFITLVEPVLLVVMGVIIAFVVLALYMPLFELSSVVGS